MHTIDPVLLKIYSACTDSNQWGEALDLLCAQVGASTAVLHRVCIEGERATTIWEACNASTPASLASCPEVMHDVGNPRLQPQRLRRLGSGPVVIDDDALFQPQESPLKLRLQERLQTIGLGRFMGALTPFGESEYLCLAVHLSPGEENRFADRSFDWLRSLMPHIGQAYSLGSSIASNRAATALVHGHLEHWQCGLIVCDEAGHVQWLNQKARDRVSASDALQLKNGRIQARSALAQHHFVGALLQSARSDSATFLALDTPTGRLQLAVQALGSASHLTNGLLLVSFASGDEISQIPASALKSLFDLTNAEARLACALVSGFTVEQFAQRRGVTVGTVRYQVNQILMKTGTNRQADLVRRILGSVAAYLSYPPVELTRDRSNRLRPITAPGLA
jgi:DNA-binding NarL/FixJ family response regulator